MLEIKDVSKTFGGKPVLKDLAFNCKIGEIVGIFGRNGSGKSSLLKIVYGTLKADSVSIAVNSEALRPQDVIPSGMIAYLPQETFLPKNLKVRNTIPLFFPEGDEQDKIFYAKGVSAFENKKIGQLSLGQLRYLEILLIGNLRHPYLMLDEPFSMIEPLYKDSIKKFLIKLKERKGIVVTDHYYRDVLEITDINFLIKNGKRIEIENRNDLITHEYLNEEYH